MGTEWVTAVIMAMQSARSQLQIPPIKGDRKVHIVWHRDSFSKSAINFLASSLSISSNPELSGPLKKLSSISPELNRSAEI